MQLDLKKFRTYAGDCKPSTVALNEKVRFAFALRLSHAQQSSFDLCVSVKLRCVTVYGYEGK
jgi:hypothetical protein